MNNYIAYDETIPNEYACEHPTLMRKLLFRRSIPEDTISAFINPQYNHIHDPFLFQDMHKVVARIQEAIQKKERIVLLADYDCDGMSSAKIMYTALTLLGSESVVVRISDPHGAGYGFSKEVIEEELARNTTLFITLDCGISENESIAHATNKGVDVMVVDHHEPSGDIPTAFAIINPILDDKYPEQYLCAAALAFKCVQALFRDSALEQQEKWLLDFVGMATVADMMHLQGENRALVHYGLQVLNKTRHHGLKTLISFMRLGYKSLTEDDISFSLAPCINVAGRIGDPADVMTIFISRDKQDIKNSVERLVKKNDERKRTVQTMMRKATKRIQKRENNDVPIWVLGDSDWHPRLVGLLAGRLADKYHKTVFVWGRGSDGKARGSARSHNNIHLISLMQKGQHLFEKFGGHSKAGGFRIKEECVAVAQEELNNIIGEYKEKTPEVVYDEHITLQDITSVWDIIQPLHPFGMGNPKPLFKLTNVTLKEVNLLSTKKHARYTLTDATGAVYPAIHFFIKNIYESGDIKNIYAHIEKDNNNIRLYVVDIEE